MSRGNPSPPDRPGQRAGPIRDVIFEFTRVGDQTKVCAVDSGTGAEAVVFGPASAAQSDLERLALNKLRYVMRDGAGAQLPAPSGTAGRSGKLV